MALAIDAGATDVPLIEMTIGDLLEQTVAEHGDREALVVTWPLVRHHPVTGAKSLYFGAYVTIGIDVTFATVFASTG